MTPAQQHESIAQRVADELASMPASERGRRALAVFDGALRTLAATYAPTFIAQELYRHADEYACMAPRYWPRDDKGSPT